MRWLPWALLATAGALAFLAMPAQSQSALISNGVVQLGVNDGAMLNAPGGAPPPLMCNSSVTIVGVRYLPTGCEATADGCTCEGWGAAYDNLVEGCADTANCGGMIGMAVGSFTSTPTTAISIVNMGDLRITHDFHPISATSKVYQVNVTLANVGTAAMENVTYRRSMDWDIEPTPFLEYSSLESMTPVPAVLQYSCLNGFIPELILTYPLPLNCNPSPSDCYAGMGPPTNPNIIDSGVCDHGAVFDFNFGGLSPGTTRQFSIYYGAGNDDADARAVLALISAQVWSLGKCGDSSNPDCDTSIDPATGHVHGGPQTFIFAFTGLNPILSVEPEFSYAFTTTSPDDLTFDPVQFTDLSTLNYTLGAGTPVVTWFWDFGDSYTSTLQNPAHEYMAPGIYTVCLTVTATLVDYGVTASGTVCHDVKVNNRPPDARIANLGGRWGARVFDRSTDRDGSVVSSCWDYGDASIVCSPYPPTHVYDATGMYTVCMTATDDYGATATTCTVVLYIKPEQALDVDQDGVEDAGDNCPAVPNRAQLDADRDGHGDACDGAPEAGDAEGPPAWKPLPPGVPDSDLDGIADATDNCPAVPNRGQGDLDQDHLGDVCDTDADGDHIAESGPRGAILDNCPGQPNPAQTDRDGDKVGDDCQIGGAADGGSALAASGAVRDAQAGQDVEAQRPVWATGLVMAAVAFVAILALLVPVLRRGKA